MMNWIVKKIDAHGQEVPPPIIRKSLKDFLTFIGLGIFWVLLTAGVMYIFKGPDHSPPDGNTTPNVKQKKAVEEVQSESEKDIANKLGEIERKLAAIEKSSQANTPTSPASSSNPSSSNTASVAVFSPRNGATVTERQDIKGTISDLSADVWVVVHLINDKEYIVQPAADVDEHGKWTVNAQFGAASKADSGKKYEVRAYADPTLTLKKGKMNQWPMTATKFDSLEVTRQ